MSARFATVRGVSLLLSLVFSPGCGDQQASEGETGGASGDCPSAPAQVTPPEGATLKFMDPCTAGEDTTCETNLCFVFNKRGPHCSVACTRDCECPAPSGGCSGMGVCKAPGG